MADGIEARNAGGKSKAFTTEATEGTEFGRRKEWDVTPEMLGLDLPSQSFPLCSLCPLW